MSMSSRPGSRPALTGVLLGGLAALHAAAPEAQASSHREAPAIATDPAADNTDLYAWVTPGSHEHLNIVANWIPLEAPAGGPNFHEFSDEVLYEIHLLRPEESLNDAITYQFRFRSTPYPQVDPADLAAPPGGGKEFFSQLAGRTQTYNVTRIMGGRAEIIARDVPVAPPNIGPKTMTVLNALTGGAVPPVYDDAYAASFTRDLRGGGRVFAGPRDDGFYVDLAGVFDLANLRLGIDGLAPGPAEDGVAGFNTHSIAMQIPIAQVTSDREAPNERNGKIGVWSSSSRRQVTIRRRNGRSEQAGPWIQVSRLGLPLVNEVLIGLQDKDRFNASHPRDDVSSFGAYFLNPVIVRDAEAVGIYNILGVDQGTVDSLKSNRVDILAAISLATPETLQLREVGDFLRLNLWQDSAFPNGRSVGGGERRNQAQVDVTDVLMTVILSGGAIPLADGVNSNDKDFLPDFPWLPLPHEGFSSPQDRPAP